jgi:glycopeptide antibiotics resistance protein
MIWEVFIGPYRSFAGVRRYNIHPFKTIIEYLFNTKQYSSRVIFINIVANIITFIPLGFFLCLLFKRFRKPFNMALCSFIVIAIIEIMQFVLNVGVFDVDDIVLNTAGCLLGYVIYRIMKKFMSKS